MMAWARPSLLRRSAVTAAPIQETPSPAASLVLREQLLKTHIHLRRLTQTIKEDGHCSLLDIQRRRNTAQTPPLFPAHRLGHPSKTSPPPADHRQSPAIPIYCITSQADPAPQGQDPLHVPPAIHPSHAREVQEAGAQEHAEAPAILDTALAGIVNEITDTVPAGRSLTGIMTADVANSLILP
uniref:Uncharacterized protein n=1 Tax=Sphaerodactylus townsendi TaxID=933632 RepID=A0ACB8FY46_9SAUR